MSSVPRLVAVLLTLVTTAALTACGGDDDGDGPAATPATVSPTALGDRPLVTILEAGTGERRALALAPSSGTAVAAEIAISQEIVTDQRPSVVPPITIPVEVAVTGVEAGTISSTQSYAEPVVDAQGLAPAEVQRVRDALASLAGSTSELSVRGDGTTVEASSGVAAAAQVDSQLRTLVPVLPTEEVGVGATWTATSVADVDGALVDQVATYDLDSLEGDAYVIEVTLEQTYRPGVIEGVEVRSGRSLVTATLTGSLGGLLPAEASGTVTTQLSYVVQDRVTEVRTTVTLALSTT